MSSAARLENLGRLQEHKQRAIALSVEMHTLRGDINRATNPHRPIEALNTHELGVLLDRLHDISQAHRALCAEIRALCEDLGEPVPNVDLGRG